MNKQEICNRLKDVIVKIVSVDEEGRVASQGTGVFINSEGLILTANHVIKTSLSSPRQILAIPYRGRPRFPVFVAFSDVSIDIGDQDALGPLHFDLAILSPTQKAQFPFIQLEDEIPSEGTEIIMAGYPEDLKPPLNFTDAIRYDKPEFKPHEAKIRELTSSMIGWIMFKHGIVGSVFKIDLKVNSSNVTNAEGPFSIRAAEYWLDNSSARSASGGPVVSMHGNLIGIITETGETTSSHITGTLSFDVPSGSTRVLSHKLITWNLDRLKEQLKLGN